MWETITLSGPLPRSKNPRIERNIQLFLERSFVGITFNSSEISDRISTNRFAETKSDVNTGARRMKTKIFLNKRKDE